MSVTPASQKQSVRPPPECGCSGVEARSGSSGQVVPAPGKGEHRRNDSTHLSGGPVPTGCVGHFFLDTSEIGWR